MDITAIPGLIVDLVRYLVEILFLSPSALEIIMLFTAPLALGALCGVSLWQDGAKSSPGEAPFLLQSGPSGPSGPLFSLTPT